MKKILIMGLPGSGKTTLAEKLKSELENLGKSVVWFNADCVRQEYNDWDFSPEGRLRQAERMAKLAESNSTADFVIADFVAPNQETRRLFAADIIIWMDTIAEGRFEDTNKAFVYPTQYDYRIGNFDSEHYALALASKIVNKESYPTFDNRKETVQMLGRWQPWHAGHRALFERALAKTGQVCIMIRDCQGWNNSNPFDIDQVKYNIDKNLDFEFRGRYTVMVVPNIVNITYGRDVGYKIEQEVFDDTIHRISATQIRKDMGIE